MERILAILRPLLTDLRSRTRELSTQDELSLTYELDSEAGQ